MAAPRPQIFDQRDPNYQADMFRQYGQLQQPNLGLGWNGVVPQLGSVTVCGAAPGAMTYTASSLHG